MFIIRQVCFAIGLTLAAAVAAQPISPGENQKAFDNYLQHSINRPLGGAILEEVSIRGLAANAGNINKLRPLVKANISEMEKIAAIRLLGGMYIHREKAPHNAAVAADIKAQVFSANAKVAQAALFVYSRLGYFPDTRATLKYVRDKGILVGDGYYGELAHLVAFAPESDQLAILDEIALSKNGYAGDIIANTLASEPMRRKFGPASTARLRTLLANTEPGFPMPIGEFGMFDAFRYADWLNASAHMDEASGRKKYRDFVVDTLSQEHTEPRKILAFLTSHEGKALASAMRADTRVAKLKARVLQYALSFPGNADLQELAGTIP